MSDVAPVAIPAEPTRPWRYRVAAKRYETGDSVTLDLDAVETPIAAPVPGQFVMLYAFGVGEAPISTAGVSSQGTLRHTVRRVGAVTRAICDLEVGDQIGVRGPYGSSWRMADAVRHDLVIVAGGIGMAPLRPVVERALSERGHFGNMAMLVGARTPHDLLYRDELEVWRSRTDIDVMVTVDQAARGWDGDVGVVTTLIGRLDVAIETARAFVCGPEVMMRFTARALQDAGMAAANIEVSLERNMQCAVRNCGHCQIGPVFVCSDGPVFGWDLASSLMEVRSR